MRLPTVVALLTALCACGSSSRDASTAAAPPARGPACNQAPTALACPTDPDASPTCDAQRSLQMCSYPDRACRCELPFSGGAPPSPDAQWMWRCAVAIRPDGCPGLVPFNRTCCSGPDHDCTYPGGYEIACKAGVWLVLKEPPPSA